MKQDLITSPEQLLSPTEAARTKGLTLNQLKYHMTKPGAPVPVYVGRFRHPFYYERDIEAWSPNLQPQKGGKR